MNKTLLALLVILALGVTLLLVLRKGETKDVYAEFPERDFAVRDADLVHRIFIADRKGRSLTLTRQPDNQWLINDSLTASPDIVRQMLATLEQLQIDVVPPKATQATALQNIQADALKVEAYDAEGHQLKSILFGTATAGTRSTFAVVEGHDEVFAVRRGFVIGNVRPLFDLRSINSFRDLIFIRENPEQIQSVEVRYPSAISESFRIARVGDSLRIDPLQELVGRSAGVPKQRLLESYLEGFADIPLFGRIEDAGVRDSVTRVLPQVQIVLQRSDNSRDTFEIQPSLNLNNRGQPDPEVPFSNYYVERGTRELALVQDHQLAPIMRGYASFFE